MKQSGNPMANWRGRNSERRDLLGLGKLAIKIDLWIITFTLSFIQRLGFQMALSMLKSKQLF
jgi:hypothetical protein